MDYVTKLDMQVNAIFLGCFFAFLGFIFICLTITNQRKFRKILYFVSSFVSFGVAILTICGAILNSQKTSLSFVILLGIGVSLLTISYRDTYKNCSVKVNAVLKEYHIIYRAIPNAYQPLFMFKYNNTKYEVYDLQFYYKRKFLNKFKVGDNYEVFINPKDPSNCCVYKSVKNHVSILGFILSAIIIVLGIFIVITA